MLARPTPDGASHRYSHREESKELQTDLDLKSSR